MEEAPTVWRKVAVKESSSDTDMEDLTLDDSTDTKEQNVEEMNNAKF